jgi:phosphoribosylformimino-5-aminoimidazole carboxamide ribotide isomerase
LFAEAGASHLHVVDLDGAFAGARVNGAAVESIIAPFPGKVQVGGGIRNRAGVDRWLALGVERVIIGTAALKDPEFVKAAARDLPGRIVVGVDARDGMVATEGWADVSDVRVDRSRAAVRGCRRRGAALHRCRPRRAAQGLQCRCDRRARAAPSRFR